ncbi:MAG: hypothetical protein EOO72_00750 [Myxococcaceae bacterium]|nr:MAG: hypothetical protein EOO72_00750 [Myxococcaceae bacterium]
MFPAFFRSSRALPLLGAVAVGSSLALAAAATTGMVLSHAAGLGFLTACGALPTVLVGLVWVALLRGNRLAGWLLALPLAAASAAPMMVMASPYQPVGELHWTLTVGLLHALATSGAMLMLGLPLAWSRRQARLGLAGAERGEILVGVECVWLAAWALVVRAAIEQLRYRDDVLAGVALEAPGQRALLALAVIGVVSGLGTAALALWRGRRRRALIASAEAGERRDYRVEHTPAGRVLIRVRVAADDYRQADADEESFDLDEAAFEAARSAPPAP